VANRVLTTLFFGTAPTDPLTLAAVISIIASVSAIGC